MACGSDDGKKQQTGRSAKGRPFTVQEARGNTNEEYIYAATCTETRNGTLFRFAPSLLAVRRFFGARIVIVRMRSVIQWQHNQSRRAAGGKDSGGDDMTPAWLAGWLTGWLEFSCSCCWSESDNYEMTYSHTHTEYLEIYIYD
eukprot:GHVU01009049.1.p2 GENE.GHVU01009049.1~~GHVU01009049.1.p2  ORF type:complete len:143 (+),score=14.90 GHVU01009049.1:2139-2567(+)